MNKNLLIVLGKRWEQRRFPSNGGTLLLVATLVLTVGVWAKPLTGPADPTDNPKNGPFGMTFALYDVSIADGVVAQTEAPFAVQHYVVTTPEQHPKVSIDDAVLNAIGLSFVPSVPTSALPSPATSTAISPTTFIDICTQNPAKCPVDEETWPGEPDAWQRTGRKWQWHSGTPSGFGAVWELSAPYAGPNPAYAGQRENYYNDYSNTPDEYPTVTGTAPIPYSWARWEPTDANYILHQYGGASEEQALTIGESNCDSGIYFPVAGPDVTYAYTPMSVVRDGQCVSGGYLVTYRSEVWGPPLSPIRVNRCDNPDIGIPVSQSQRGNAICKLSPYVAVVSQRYVIGPGPAPTDRAGIGCEMVLYVWGWLVPQQVSSGQDYQARFRDGELRYTKWINLSDQVSGGVPAPDDHAWWETRCERAWSGITNWVYTGLYRIGTRVYTDTIALPPTTVAEIPLSGGNLTSTIDNSLYMFPPNTFTDTVILTQTIRFQSDFTSTGYLIGINRFYEMSATYSSSGQPAQPVQPYTVTIHYADADKAAAIEDTLALYYLDRDQWVREPTSVVFTDTNSVVAAPAHFSVWAVLGETQRIFLPLVLR